MSAKRVLPDRRESLGPAQQPPEGPSPHRVQPLEHLGGRRLPPLGLLPLSSVRVPDLAAQVEPERRQQRGRVVGRHRVGEVEIVDGVPVRGQVRGEPLVAIRGQKDASPGCASQ